MIHNSAYIPSVKAQSIINDYVNNNFVVQYISTKYKFTVLAKSLYINKILYTDYAIVYDNGTLSKSKTSTRMHPIKYYWLYLWGKIPLHYGKNLADAWDRFR